MMRIGIDASTWFNARGFGRFTRELVNAMVALRTRHDLVLFFDRTPPPIGEVESVQVKQTRLVTEAAVEDANRGLLDIGRFCAAIGRSRLDVMFFPAVYSWFPCPPKLPNVVTLHDAIAERFPTLVFPKRRSRMLWTAKVRLACFQADRLLTVSDAARREIERYLRIDPSRVDVTTEGPGAAFRPLSGQRLLEVGEDIRRRFDLPPDSRYFCYVGGFAPHKNVRAIVLAFADLLTRGSNDTHLLLVGALDSQGFSSDLPAIREVIAGNPQLTARVHWTGFVDDSLLACIYATSLALLMPSLSEGFGLPALESMACGTPVIASSEGALPEVVGDAGVIVQPSDTHAIANAMADLSSDRSRLEHLRGIALDRASRFTWERGARLALQSIERCRDQARRRRL